MGLSGEEAVRAAVASSSAVLPVGSGTHREVGNPVDAGATEVRAPAGVVAYDPAELTITVGAGTAVAELSELLAASGQECALDPRDPAATIGGTLAAGLSGHRRLRYGPLRDRVLEVRFVTGDARIVRGGGPTVKNVTGYDMPRLLVGSLGTLGVMTRVILRCQPRAATSAWFAGGDPAEIRARCAQPSTILWHGGERSEVLLEGHGDDVEAQRAAAGLVPIERATPWPGGSHRGRVSVAPGALRALGSALDELAPASAWVAEWAVGTVHVAAESSDALAAARAHAMRSGGWMLREAGAPDLDGFGVPLPNEDVMTRLSEAFDPFGKLAPGRLPLARPAVQREAARP